MNRHRFEPARLLLGLLLVGAALSYVMQALGSWRLPAWALLLLVPAALVVAAGTAAATFAVRRLLRRRRAAAPRAPGAMPVDEPRAGYERSYERSYEGDGRPGASKGGGPETS